MMLYKRLIWLKKISFTDSGRHHWPEKSIEGGGSMPKVLKNSRWSWKKVTTFGENIRPGQCQPYGSQTVVRECKCNMRELVCTGREILWYHLDIARMNASLVLFKLWHHNKFLVVGILRSLLCHLTASLKYLMRIFIISWLPLPGIFPDISEVISQNFFMTISKSMI